MALNNSQYDSILRNYQLRQAWHRHQRDLRIQEAFERFPRLREIDDDIASLSVKYGRQLLNGDTTAPVRQKSEIALLAEERQALLAQGGYPSDYLDMTYDCPDCRDSGYRDGQKCHCFKKAEIDLLYTQSNIKEIVAQENFNTFSYDYYSGDFMDPSGEVSSLERIHKVNSICHQFVDDFDTVFSNLFFYGDTGVGKTFLSHCIARELIETTHSVIYFSAQELFEIFASKRFGRQDGMPMFTDYIYDCDLLIIDDLGTELTNTFVNSELFLCVNERLNRKKSTIISTNLTLDVFADTYSERIFSRISNNYTMLKIFGRDIRLLKKIEKKNKQRP